MSRTSTAASKNSRSTASSSMPKSRAPSTRQRKSVGDGLDRHQMIAIAAYYRAEQRGFNGGNPIDDWLAAEAEIDRQYH